MGNVEVVPAILVKSVEDFSSKIALVSPYVSRVQLDIMDGKFVPNETLAVELCPEIPKHLLVEYHLMVEHPLEYVKRIGKKGAIYELHLESFTKAGGRGGKSRNPKAEPEVLEAISQIKKMGGRVGIAISPDTPVEEVEPYLKQVELVLVMTVYPGFSGQKYLPEMEQKMRWLSKRGVVVEVDGGVDIGNARRAAAAGATLLGAASSIFAKPDLKKAIADLEKDAQG